jgi:hypothetical protein
MQNKPAAADEFTAQCGCGKRYRVAAEKRGRKLKCHACGDVYLAEPAPPKARATPSEGSAVKPTAHADHPAEHTAHADVPRVASSVAPGMSRAVTSEPVNPAPLLKDLSRGNLPVLIAVALVLHIMIIGVTSVGHISLCLKYHTLWPKPVMKKEREEEEKRKLEEKQVQQQKAMEEKQAADATAQGTKKAEGPSARPTTDENKNGKPKSKIEQTLEEKSNERPKEGTIRLDEPGSLE